MNSASETRITSHGSVLPTFDKCTIPPFTKSDYRILESFLRVTAAYSKDQSKFNPSVEAAKSLYGGIPGAVFRPTELGRQEDIDKGIDIKLLLQTLDTVKLLCDSDKKIATGTSKPSTHDSSSSNDINLRHIFTIGERCSSFTLGATKSDALQWAQDFYPGFRANTYTAEYQSVQRLMLHALTRNLAFQSSCVPTHFHVDDYRFFYVFYHQIQAKYVCWPFYRNAGDPMMMFVPPPNLDRSVYKAYQMGVLMKVGSQLQVCDGQSIIVSILNPKLENRYGDALQNWIENPTADDMRRWDTAAEEHRRVIFVRKNWGATHPEFPYCVMKDIKFVDDPIMIEEIFKVSDSLRLGLNRLHHDFQHLVVPFSFPPPVDDLDEKMQRNIWSTGEPFSNETDALEYFESELRSKGIDLGSVSESSEDVIFPSQEETKADREEPRILLENITEERLHQEMSNPDSDTRRRILKATDEVKHNRESSILKEQAWENLRKIRARNIARAKLRALFDRVVEKILYEKKIKEEQEMVSNRWTVKDENSTSGTKKSKNKKLKKASVAAADHGGSVDQEGANRNQQGLWGVAKTMREKVDSIVDRFVNKVNKYRHYKKTLNTLKKHGIMDAYSLQTMRGSHRVLHGCDTASLTIVEPHGNKTEHSRREFKRAFAGVGNLGETTGVSGA